MELGEAAIELLKAVVRQAGYPAHVPDTGEYRSLFANLQREVAEMPPGVVPHIPWDYNQVPEPYPLGPSSPPASPGVPYTIQYAGIGGQALDLGWRFNPAEARNAHGEWTKAGSGYTVPDHSRLILDHPPKNSRFPYYRAPEDHPFFKAHPVSAANVLKVYDASTPEEKAQGMRWYADAHTLATAIGHGDTEKGAGLLAAYSPQTAWPVNMFNAARAVELNRALGPGDGMITHATQANAQEVLDGTPLDQVFGKNKAPKIRAFAHLILHGGDAPDDTAGNVVIDRHAMSVAMGERLPKVEADKAPIGTDRYYQHVADAYRAAAVEATRRGTPVSPHQMQAITWLHQQAANAAEDAAGAAGHGGKGAGHGRRVMVHNAWSKWNAEASSQHLPVTVGTTALSGGLAGQVADLAFNPMEPRDSRGRWTRFGGVPEAVKQIESSREGFSVSVQDGGMPVHGYMVALDGHTHTYPETVMDDPKRLARAIDDMLMSEREAFSRPGMFLGGWVSDGKLWLDPSENIADHGEAVRAGQDRNQVAIWDIDNGREVSTGGTGGGRIIEHAHAQDDRARAGGILRPARGRAAGAGRGAGAPAPGGIVCQLDLGWHDAWRHELRGPHGEWVKGTQDDGKSYLDSELYPGEFSDKLIRYWHSELDGNAKDYLNKASAYFDEGDTAAASRLLMKAAGHAADKTDAQRYESLAQRIESSGSKSVADQKLAHEFMEKADDIVPKMFGPNESLDWDDKPPTVFDDMSHPDFIAQIDWNGHVMINKSTVAGIRAGLDGTGPIDNPDAFTVPLHELIHVVLPPGQKRSSNGDMNAYQEPAGRKIEEGFTQLATAHHAGEFFTKLGLGSRPTQILARDDSGSAISDPAFAAAVSKFADDLDAKQKELAADGRQQYTQAAHRLAVEAQRLRADPMNADMMLFDDDFGNPLSQVQHLGDSALSDWARQMRARGLALQKMPTDTHYTMAQWADEMAKPSRIMGGDSWPHYAAWTADALTWVSDIATRMDNGKDPSIPRKLADQISSVGTATKPRVMADQLIVAAGLLRQTPPLTKEQIAAARQSAIDEILASWTDEPTQAAARAEKAFRNTVTSMRTQEAAAA